MTLSVQLNKSTPSNYRLVLPLVPEQTSVIASEELVLNIHSTIIPGVNLENIDTEWQSTRRKNAGGPMNFEDFQVDFIVDTELKNWKLLFNWMSYISNNKDKMMESYKNFSIDGSLQVLDNFHSEILRLSFVDMWPNALGSVALSHREGEAVLECNATFAYDYFEIK